MLIAAAISLILGSLPTTLTGRPTILIENPIVPTLITLAVCFLLVCRNTFECIPIVESIFSIHQFLVECGNESQAKLLRERYPELFTDSLDPMEATKQHLNETVFQTEDAMQPGALPNDD